MTERLLLDVREVALLLGCGRTYVYGMIQRGELPVVKLGRLTRIPRRAVEHLAESGTSDWADGLLAMRADTSRFVDR